MSGMARGQTSVSLGGRGHAWGSRAEPGVGQDRSGGCEGRVAVLGWDGSMLLQNVVLR